MERLNTTDAGFYFAEHEHTPLHIASVAIFEGPAPAQPEVERMLLARLERIPRYRQRVQTVPFGLGRPVWTDDPRFQLDYHLRRTAVPHPGGSEEFGELAGRVLGHRLDLSRSPWEIWLVEGLAGDRWALISKVHHCVVDGVGGSDLIASLFDLRPDGRPPAEPVTGWRPGTQPSMLSLMLAGVCTTFWEPTRLMLRMPSILRRGLAGIRVPGPPRLPGLPGRPAPPGRQGRPGPHHDTGGLDDADGEADGEAAGVEGGPDRAEPDGRGGLQEIWDYTTGLPHMAENIAHQSVPCLSGPIRAYRRWSWAQADLGEIKAIRHRYGVTVNDVVLATVSRGLRDLLAARGELADQTIVRSLVPVSLRSQDQHGILDNRISGLVVALPCGEADPVRRLRILHAQMEELKRTHQEVSVDALIRLAGYSPPTLPVVSRLTRAAIRPIFQTIVTNVPGPQLPLYVLGRRLISLYPYVPVAAGAGVSVGIFSYDGALYFGITGDFDGFPDLDVLASGIAAGVAELLKPLRVAS